MTIEHSDTLDWPQFRSLRLLMTFSDNASEARLNEELLFSNVGAATPIFVYKRLDPKLRLGENVLVFRGHNNASAPQNPNPWRFDLFLQDNLGDAWDTYRDYSRRSDGYPGGNQPLGLAYKLTLTINLKA